MLTYMGFELGLGQWGRFLSFVADHLKPWKTKHWCATLETTKDGEPHVHLMLQLNSKVDSNIAGFMLEGAAHNRYGKQVPLSRAVPLWGEFSPGGFNVIAFHPSKKIQVEEWVDAVDSGALSAVMKQGHPTRARYPRRVLCDNAGFLSADERKAAYRKQKVNLWHVPAHIPDLNVIEKYWSWLRRNLRRRDLEDLMKKRAPLGKMAYRHRVLAICRSRKSKTVAANIFHSFRKVCKEVLEKNGAMARC